MNDDEPGDVILQRITITRRLRGEDSIESYSIDYASDINWLADLGLLEAAKLDLQARCHDDRGEWEDDGEF